MSGERLTREEALTRLEMANLIEERAIQTGRFVETVADFQTAFGPAYSSAELAAHFAGAREIARWRLSWTPQARQRAQEAASPPLPPPAPPDDLPAFEPAGFWAVVFGWLAAILAATAFVLCLARHV